MNKVETLVKQITVLDKVYIPHVYLTGWGRWCVAYVNIVNSRDKLCSVVVEPENNPVDIMDVPVDSLNAGIGNARTLDDAIDMIINYIDKTYGKR